MTILSEYCTRCGEPNKIVAEHQTYSFDIKTGQRERRALIRICEECSKGLCFCDVCFDKTTYDSYKDHLNIHTKEQLVDLLNLFKVEAERNIRGF